MNQQDTRQTFRVTVTCNECQHRMELEQRKLPEDFHVVCHSCEKSLKVSFHESAKR